MKKSIWIIVAGSVAVMAGSDMALYKVRSGKVDYAIKGSGGLMGMSTKTIGKKRLIFTDYGANSLTEENKITKQKGMGQESTQKEHTIIYMKNGIAYHVDLNRKRILRREDIGMMMSAMGGNAAQKGEAMLKQMGGKKTGKDKVLGYTCDVWELMGTKQCIYKGIPLRVETDVMGIKSSEVATKAEFDIDISESDLKMPDFPIYDMSGRQIPRDSLERMDQASQKEIAQTAAFANEMQKAAQEAGVVAGKEPTASQKEMMMNAMLPMMKQQMLSEEQNLKKARNCIEDADTLKEAKQCAREMGGEGDPEEGLPTVWNAQTKKQTLDEIDQGLEMMACVKRAKTMQEAQVCMGE